MSNISININPKTYGSINSKHYFELISRPELDEQDQFKVQAFEKLMGEAERYRDYLVGPLKSNKDSYENGINQLAMLSSLNPNLSLSTNEKRAIEAYNVSKSHLREIQEQKVRKLTKNDSSYGYTNAFALILSVLGTGILIGVVLFMMMK